MQNHRQKCSLWEICDAAPWTNDGVFTFGRLGQWGICISFYFFYFVAFQEFAVLQSTICPF